MLIEIDCNPNNMDEEKKPHPLMIEFLCDRLMMIEKNNGKIYTNKTEQSRYYKPLSSLSSTSNEIYDQKNH